MGIIKEYLKELHLTQNIDINMWSGNVPSAFSCFDRRPERGGETIFLPPALVEGLQQPILCLFRSLRPYIHR